MGSYRTEGLGKAGRGEGTGILAPSSVWVLSPQEPGEQTREGGERGKGSKRNGINHSYIKHRQELDRQVADKRWVEELCEQQPAKQVSQRPRAEQ